MDREAGCVERVGGGTVDVREAATLGLVAVEQRCGCAMQDIGELPREVDRVADAGVHALGTGGAVKVRGITEQEHATGAEMIGDAVMHVIAGEVAHVHVRQLEPLRHILRHVFPRLGRAVRLGRRADHAGAADRERERGEKLRRVERDMELAVQDRAGAIDIGDEEQMRVRRARQADAERRSHRRVRTIAARDVRGAACQAVVEPRVDAVFILRELDERTRSIDLHAGGSERADQQALVRALRIHQLERIRAEPFAETRELDSPGVLAADPPVRRRRSPALADHLVGDAELAIELERARRDADRARRGARLGDLVDDPDAHARASEPQRVCETGWARADDEDVRVSHGASIACVSPSRRE